MNTLNKKLSFINSSKHINCAWVEVLQKLVLLLIAFLIIFCFIGTGIAYAEENPITAKELYDYLVLCNNNYNVFHVPNYSLPTEIYPARCSLDIIVPQRYDSYCVDPIVISDHISGKKLAHECCQKYGIDWHRSHVIYLKNTDVNKPVYPGWSESMLNPNINPDFLPVPAGNRWGFSDWDRGGSRYQRILYLEATDLVSWVDSGRFSYAVNFVESNIQNLSSKDPIYSEFLKRVNNGEFLNAVEDARNFLNEIKVKGITIEGSTSTVSAKECLTCK